MEYRYLIYKTLNVQIEDSNKRRFDFKTEEAFEFLKRHLRPSERARSAVARLQFISIVAIAGGRHRDVVEHGRAGLTLRCLWSTCDLRASPGAGRFAFAATRVLQFLYEHCYCDALNVMKSHGGLKISYQANC
ncbi:uncharacterized protein LOC113373595 [Ctenocephalides felis]|uniref:uncharacterized protein LOC113373595 n=1 Tax=Ctenocephalides felis TaxID=7515 RepID=UPI000E6E29FF|nr:uncharacterized protein LOC113373595 [Ctenocephalides felis]